jgi:hypothetical protein
VAAPGVELAPRGSRGAHARPLHYSVRAGEWLEPAPEPGSYPLEPKVASSSDRLILGYHCQPKSGEEQPTGCWRWLLLYEMQGERELRCFWVSASIGRKFGRHNYLAHILPKRGSCFANIERLTVNRFARSSVLKRSFAKALEAAAVHPGCAVGTQVRCHEAARVQPDGLRNLFSRTFSLNACEPLSRLPASGRSQIHCALPRMLGAYRRDHI